ncbi:sensor histidine kinase [Psychrobacter sp. 72-O-c]|uniref:sensor histidine kinase n=1 Tax=Psychrobacter sp. 72-O-c TaxID=2774125 RepID=UPI00191A85EA|nr:ATP-binding protein [Psychrobacter sp. 72-O-c]
MPSIRQLFNSMQFQLIFWSVLALLLLAVVAGGYGFWHSYEELNEFQDDNLKSMTAVLEQTLNIETSDSSSLQQTNIHFDTDDDDGSITVDIINTDINAPIIYSSSHDSTYNSNNDAEEHNEDDFDDITVKDLPTIPVGISTKTIDGKVWRVYRSNNDSDNHVIIVRQRTEFQDDLAKDSALQSFLPLILGMSFLVLLLPFIMWRMLKPVRHLQTEISQRRESDLNPLPVSNLPTELLPLAESLNRLLALVKVSIERQQRFIADAAHELRSPLTAISLQLQRLQRLSNDEIMTTGLNKLAIRLKRNQSLIEQLLTLARAGNINATHNTEQQSVSVKAIVEQVIGLLIPIIDNKNIELTVQLSADPLLEGRVNMDETSLLLLVKNLIQNAIVYTPDYGQVAVELFHLQPNSNNFEASALNTQSNFGTQVIHSGKINKLSTPLENKLVLQIMDTGQGINPKDYASVFEPFTRIAQTSKALDKFSENPTDTLRSDNAGKRTNEIDGTGLGLSIVKSICEQANIDVFMKASTLTATSGEESQGLCVTLLL